MLNLPPRRDPFAPDDEGNAAHRNADQTIYKQGHSALFSPHLGCVAKPCAKATRGRVRNPKASRNGSRLYFILRAAALECGASPHRFSQPRCLLFPKPIAETAHGF